MRLNTVSGSNAAWTRRLNIGISCTLCTVISTARVRTLLLIAILLFAAGFRLALLNAPFARNTEGCAAFFAQLARNYFRYDFAQSHGIPIMSMGKGAPVVFYANHPPTTPMLIALVHVLSGYAGSYDQLPGDWQVRLPTAVFTLGCIVIIYILLKNRGSPRAGLIAAMLFASIPMTLTFGGFPDVISPQLVFFAMLTIAAYERFHDELNLKNFGWLVAMFFGAAIMDWPAFHLVPVLGLHFVITKKAKQWPWIAGFGLVSVVIFVALYVYLTMGQTDLKWMLTQFGRRGMSSAGDSAHKFSWGEWFDQAIWTYAIGRHTVFVTIFAIAWLIGFAIRFFNRKSTEPSRQPSPGVPGEGARGGADRLTGLLLAWAFVHVLLGRQGVFQHEWWWWPLTPGLVMAAGISIDRLLSWIERFNASTGELRTTNLCTCVVLIIFAASNIPSAWREQMRIPYPAKINYTLDELGKFIRDQTPADGCVLIAESDDSLPFWDYADRGVRRSVWNMEEFNRRSSEDFVDLPFQVMQKRPGPFVTMIAPKSYLIDVVSPDLIRYLDAHYPRKEDDKFVAWDLRTATAMR